MKALIIVDYTNDFVADNGQLTCGKPAQQIEQAIVDLAKTFEKSGDFIVLATDKHDSNDPFHPESKLFPEHNVMGTVGREFFGQLAQLVHTHPNWYQMDKTRYSAFFGTNLDSKLRERHINEIHLCGVCTDICVLHTAIAAYELGYNIVVHEQAVASFNEEGHRYALTHLKNVLGANVVK